MRDYAEISKALRCCHLTSERGCAECPFGLNNNEKCANLLPVAADAIGELLADCKQQEIDLVNLTGHLAEVAADRDHLREAAKMMPQWISVEDEPPKENGRYLARYKRDVDLGDETVHEDDIRIMRFFTSEGWRYPIICNDHVRLLSEEVTHWMPLPAPPEGEEKP